MGRRLVSPVPFLLLILAGCSAFEERREPPQQAHGPGDVVFVADGAGDYRKTSQAIRRLIREDDTPLQVVTFVWSHGQYRSVADQCDHAHARAQGQRLAELVAERRCAFPESHVYLLGHSAGAAVVLAAAEASAPGMVERVILLSPSVPTSYDLRPALRHSVQGIDVHSSERDTWDLGTMVRILQCLEGVYCPVLGQCGVRPPEHAEDDACFGKLHSYPWSPQLHAATGHDGGHYGCYQQGYLRRFVLPALTGQVVGNGAVPAG